MLYLLKFEPQFRHARFYFGWCKDGTFKRRLGQHMGGSGAKIVMRAMEAGVLIVPVFVCAGTRADETRLKKWNNNARVLDHLMKKVKNDN